jgi:predicted dinucleotide-utilizing enzyme
MKIAIVGSGFIGAEQKIIEALSKSGEHVEIVSIEDLKEDPFSNPPIPFTARPKIELPTFGLPKIDCRRGHTYVNGKCRCGQETGYKRL